MRWWAGLVAVSLVGCGSTALVPTPDAGGDGGGSGGGTAATGGGGQPITDAGDEPDASAPDSGVEPPDAGPIDAGTPDVTRPLIACTDAIDDVYLTPPGLAPMTMANRGDRVRCAVHEKISQAEAQTRIGSKVTYQATTGVDIYRLSYRTYRRGGLPAISSARVYLPNVANAYPMPLIAFGHPSVGVADSCAPSKEARGAEDTALPFAAKGYAVITPDFAGLGTDGVQGYVDSVDSAQSLLDATRALRAFVAPESFSNRVVMLGYSQGGGVALAAQGLEHSYGASGTIELVAVFAPQWPSRLNSFRYLDIVSQPSALTISFGYSNPVIAALRQYAWGGAATFPSAHRQSYVGALDGMCLVPLGAVVHTGYFARDLIDEPLRASLVACVASTASPGCVEPGKSYHQYLLDNLVPPDPNGAPVLYVQGGLDTVMVVSQEAACNVPILRAANVNVTYCQDDGASHSDLPSRQIDFVVKWVEAKLSGAALPSCASPTLPACSP